MKSSGPKLLGKKTRRRQENGQVPADPNLDEQYQELCRLREKVRSLTEKATSERRRPHSKKD
jgi:hypothetical protein